MRCATSRTAWEWSRRSSATPWPLFSTSGGNESTWSAMLLWLGHSQYQRWLAAHHCGFQSVTCSSIIPDCRAERHCCAPIKQLQSHFNKISEVSPCAEESSRKQRPKGSIYAVPYWWIGRGCCFWNRTLKKLFQWWWRPGLLLASSTLMIIVSITNHQAATGIAWCFPTAAVFLLRMRTMKYKLLKPLLIQGYYAGIETSKCLAWRKMLFVSQALVTRHQDYRSRVILSRRTKQQEREWHALGVWDSSAGLSLTETGFKWAQIEPNIYNNFNSSF